MPIGSQQPAGLCRADAVPHGIEGHAERLDMFALDDGQAAEPKRGTVVARVELAAEADRPAFSAAERMEQRRRAFDNREVDRRAQVGDGEARAGDPFEHRR